MVEMDKKIDLSGFTGSQNMYKDQLGALITDGVKHFATEGEAFWAVSDMIVISKMQPKVMKEPFVSIKVSCENHSGKIMYSDGNGKELFGQKYSYCSLPNGSWDFYFVDNTLLCMGEY